MLRRFFLPALGLAATIASHGSAQTNTDTVFSFMGLPMGSPESAFHDKFPWGCTALPQTNQTLDMFLAERNCSPIDDAANPGKFNVSARFPEWAGIPPRYFTLYYWQGKLSLVRIVFNSAFFGTALETIDARYGAATKTTLDTVRNRVGGVFPRRTSRWENAASSITAYQYTTTVDESEVWYQLTSWEVASEARRKQRLREKLP